MMSFRKKIKSGALQFTLFIAVLIALILSGILLIAYTNSFFREQNTIAIQNISICNIGFTTLCQDDYKINDSLSLNSEGLITGQNVKAFVNHWGVFDLAMVQVRYKKMRYDKYALLGGRLPLQQRNAVYLSETFKPLAVVGSTKITGNAVLPEQGVRPGNISGHSFYGKSLIEGRTSVSTEKLPELKYDYSLLSQQLFSFLPHSESDYISIKKGEHYANSFSAPTKGYYSKSLVVLDAISLTGNIIIRSDEKIIVKKGAHLTDVILVAPTIVFEDRVSATLQAFADKGIIIGKDCRMAYPSAFVLRGKTNPNEKYQIKIEKNTHISGVIFFIKDKMIDAALYLTNIYIAPLSTVTGEVYCDGNLELRGTVNGTVYTNLFITNDNGSIYVNHLYDAIINSDALHPEYGGIIWDEKPKTIVKWLY